MALTSILKEAQQIEAVEENLNQLTDLYKKSQERILNQLKAHDLTGNTITPFQASRYKKLLSQINSEIEFLDKRVRSITPKLIEDAYQDSQKDLRNIFTKQNLKEKVNFDAKIHTQAINAITEQLTVDMLVANQEIKKKVQRVIRLTQQRVLEDAEISRAIARGLIEGSTRKTISDDILLSLREQLKENKLLRINGRNYRPDKYAKLVTRTRAREATTQGMINTSLQYGVDLIQISVHHHPQNDPCSKHQGKIYSISGNSKQFPRLTERPPFHPQCKHVPVPVVESFLEESGNLERMSKFSSSRLQVSNFKEFKNVESGISRGRRREALDRDFKKIQNAI